MSAAIESRLRGLRERRLLCLKELQVHLSRGAGYGAGVNSCIEQIDRINAEMLKVAAGMRTATGETGDSSSGL